MTIPPTIHISQIELGERLRTKYENIESLAQGIEDVGLVQPIVLVALEVTPADIAMVMCNGGLTESIAVEQLKPIFGLDAGGRRYHALKLLLDEGRWDGTLYHASTSVPGRPGFVLKGIDESTPLKRLLTELAENFDREDPDWRDTLPAIVKAWTLAKAEADGKSERIVMRNFGTTLGVGYANLQAAVYIWKDYQSNPLAFSDCLSIRQAYAKVLSREAQELTKIQATKSLQTSPLVQAQSQPRQEGDKQPEGDYVVPSHIDLTQSFKNANCFELMPSMSEGSFDHIYTDPDYAISVARLSSNSDNAAGGVEQDTVETSLNDLNKLIKQAWRLVRPQGFFVFWIDLDHWNLLQSWCTQTGFAVQRWPLIWHKTDHVSNAGAAYNFTKNIEYAMVCRKPNATLVKSQNTCVHAANKLTVVRDFNHPFSKPLSLHKWILSAIAIKGQSVYDPCMGAGSIPIAAAQLGLTPVGTEISPDHYANAIVNLQQCYKGLLGEVTFS